MTHKPWHMGSHGSQALAHGVTWLTSPGTWGHMAHKPSHMRSHLAAKDGVAQGEVMWCGV